ncbi:MAG: histidine triad nucleotide-binding protein [Calditrichaceae bacterium]|nr:histidine triad nucleotide-binding protein [Calditrichaceae bacterium]MBN2710067.1 histidine triad nucleotide-binding protein [Calditrichaceae bacterium]RQV94517.1 MAG: histidine triad nucleotide-binding protein [Calditrichota bacterium]
MMMEDCIFCQLVTKKIPGKIEYEDDDLMVFWDINPQAPVHLLIVPKKHIAKLSDFKNEDVHLLGKMMEAAKNCAQKLNLHEKGFRLVLNEGRDSGQSIFHIHLHMLSGRRLMWPPG